MPPFRIRAFTAEPKISENHEVVGFEASQNIEWKGESWPQYDEAAQALAEDERMKESPAHGTTYTVEEVVRERVTASGIRMTRTGLLNSQWVPRMRQVEQAVNSRYNYWRLGFLARLHSK